MSKLVLDLMVPEKYDKATVQDIVRRICQQVNLHSEGKIQARYAAQSVAPGASVAAQVGDLVWDLNTTIRNGTVGGAGGPICNYVRIGWVCNVSDPVNPSWQDLRIPTG